MKILFITDLFGGKIPTGVISKNIADEMVSMGSDVFVLSSNAVKEQWEKGQHVRCSVKKSHIPPKARLWFDNLFQTHSSSKRWRTAMCIKAMEIIRDFNPDVIYSRSTPVFVCMIASEVSKLSGIPVLMHFTDPVPPPKSWEPNLLYRSRMIKLMDKLLCSADMVSFGNEAMLNYEQSLLKCSFIEKSFVSPDSGSMHELYYTPRALNKKAVELSYLGSFYGSRNPHPLLDALSHFYEKGIEINLKIYDKNRTGIELPPFARFVGRTDDVRDALLSSDILVDLDGDDDIPVFISSKLKEYLCCGRPILSITPNGSPSRTLIQNLKTAFVCENKSIEIQGKIEQIMSCSYIEKDFDERRQLIEQFSPATITKDILTHLKSIIK